MVKQLDEEALNSYREAGRIASEVRRLVPSLVKEGMRIIDICEAVEEAIRQRGAEPAFPCNVGVNEVAAHYTSPIGDLSTVPEGSLVKVDLGVHVQGYIADTAVTICFDNALSDMVMAVEEALDAAISAIEPGKRVSEIGAVIEQVIEGYGYKPIWNLTGHQLGRYVIHAGVSVPNVSRLNHGRFEKGKAYAIEPFATTLDGAGEVMNSPNTYIYRFSRRKKVRSSEAASMLAEIESRYKTLPFTPRWLVDRFGEEKVKTAFRQLIGAKCVTGYPVLVERRGRKVAQAEHTVIVERGGCYVTTA